MSRDAREPRTTNAVAPRTAVPGAPAGPLPERPRLRGVGEAPRPPEHVAARFRTPLEAPRAPEHPAARFQAPEPSLPSSAAEALHEPEARDAWPPAASSLSGGQPLEAGTRAHFEARFAQDLGDVRIHTGPWAAASARSLGAAAYTRGREIVFGAGAYAPETPRGRALLAHELSHVVQLRRARTAPARGVSHPHDAAEREAERVARGLTSTIAAAPSAQVHLSPESPPRPVPIIALDLESDIPSARAAAIVELGAQTGPTAWSAMLRAQLSRFPDVRAGANAAIKAWARQPGFKDFLQAQADSPRGMVSDMAIWALRTLGGEGPADPENYRNVVRQRIELATDWVNTMTVEFEQIRKRVSYDPTRQPLTSPAGTFWGPSALLLEIDALRKDLSLADIDKLVSIGARSSLLLERLGAIRPILAGLKAQAEQLTQQGAMKDFINLRIASLLSATGGITSEVTDPATERIAEEIARWPEDLAVMMASQVRNQFASAQEQLCDALAVKPLPSFKKAWANFKSQLLDPILDEVDALVKEAAAIEKTALVDAERALDDLRDLGPTIEDLGGRVQAVLAAIQMEAAYTDLALTDEAAKDVFQETEWGLKQHFAAFATIAADTSLTPEQRQKAFDEIAGGPALKQIQEDIKKWHEIQEGEFRFAMLLAEIGIIVLSCYSAGIAGGIVRGLLGRGVGLTGRMLIGSAVLGAETVAFTATNRLLHVPLGGKLVDAKLPGELAQNAMLFGLLKGSGAVYDRLVAPRLPEAVVGAGKATLTFSMFQAWTIGLHRWETGEWIGLGDKRFWTLAAQNVAFLGAVHVGMGIARPLMAPLTDRVLALQLERHNARCSKLGEGIEAWQKAEALDPKVALDLTRRAKALYLERLDLLRAIHAADPTQLTKDELAHAEKVLREQISAAEETLFQGRARMTPHETLPDVFHYEGDPAAIRDHYKAKGYEVLDFHADTGRMRLKDPQGNVLDFLRSKFGVTGASRRPTAAEAEKIYEDIRAARGDTAAIAKNTGIPEGALRTIRQHVFFKKHMVFDPAQGKQVRRTFDADEDIAHYWSEAMKRTLEPDELAAFRRLMAHEYVEAMLVRSGMPYQHPDAWVQEADGSWTYRPSPEHFGAHDLAPRVDAGSPAFGHYDMLKVPLKRASKLPLRSWMEIAPEDLIVIEEPRLAIALAQIQRGLGTDTARQLIALATRGGGDPSLIGVIERISKLPEAEAQKQAKELIDRMGSKAQVPDVPEFGDPFKRGGTAQLYGMKDRPDLLVKPAGGRISREAQAMADLESLGIPTPYVTRQTVEGSPSIILEKIEGEGSKDIIGRISSLRPASEVKHADVVTRKTVEDLRRIYDILEKNKVNVGDFQFIVRASDGAVFVNDPTGLTFGAAPSGKIKTIIERFESIVKKKEAAKP
ncbi:eCIS core domain-containing protein [Sorangium sp. So ce341]|uniref:eCIS core domain-containing protein n=1 Tax=Sorangium sp. So ce341 TaxID=3133302 RepID=UPI003F5FFA47